ncbi:MAG: nuclear transport factor 2 family protein [Planctomycetota bacterium]|nr:nuclear transport factor 2 family protein [Planctomycetota bacterium]
MLTQPSVDAFTRDWLRAWNAHDLERILAHYTDDVVFSSPFGARLASSNDGTPDGILRGKPALRAYWQQALHRYPDLRFVPLGHTFGTDTLVIRYLSVHDLVACEVMTLNDQHKVTRASATYNTHGFDAAAARTSLLRPSHLTPILNVSDMEASFAWFAALGWVKIWDWGTPPTFGAVGAAECQIFLCKDGQGGKGRGPNTSTSGGPGQDDTIDKGVWMSIWVLNVDEVHQRCLARGLDVTHPPTNEPWGVREMHVRHPDGHVFRISQGLSCT